ncbi:MAG: alpha-amylase, partial [Bacteroidales bacterium]|nr:alpha-amylase [Bacteroidales bacterium]
MSEKRIIYQVLTRIWDSGRLSCWDSAALDYLHTLGVDYVWFTGIPRHATAEPFVKGDPGSPYAVCDWYDINPYLADDPAARMQEFRALVDRVHDSGLGVIIDFIPNHVARN